jgi:hypothetical protein
MRLVLRPIVSVAAFASVFYVAFIFLEPLLGAPSAHDSLQFEQLFLITGLVGLIGALVLMVVAAGILLATLSVAYILARATWGMLTPVQSTAIATSPRRGLPQQLTRFAFVYLCLALLIVAALGGTGVLSKIQVKMAKNDENRAVEFVRRNRQVVEYVGAQANEVRYDMSTVRKRHGFVYSYEVYAHGIRTVFAIVKVEHTWRGKSLSLQCLTPLGIGQRAPFKDACADAK